MSSARKSSSRPAPSVDQPIIAEQEQQQKNESNRGENEDEDQLDQNDADVDAEEDEEEWDPVYANFMRDKNLESMQQMKQLLEVMSEEQLSRYETYRSAAFPKQLMRKVLAQLLSPPSSQQSQSAVISSVPEKVAIIVAGVAKLFVGELVELSRDIMEEQMEPQENAIRPEHLREAHRRLRVKASGRGGSFSNSLHKPKPFI